MGTVLETMPLQKVDGGLVRQHLIDPELCSRCNACEETCDDGAIRHNARNYGIDADRCEACMRCITVCPTGAADSWRLVPSSARYSLKEQLSWEALPDCSPNDGAAATTQLQFLPSAPAPAVVLRNVRATAVDAETDIHHVVLQVPGGLRFVEGQTVGIVPPGTDAHGQPYAMRAYSIASARDGESPGSHEVALAVKRVLVTVNDQMQRGVCSNFLCDAKPGSTVRLIGAMGAHFVLPEDAHAPLVLVATGTGIAPMRSMVQHAMRAHRPGPIWLFYGGRTPAEMAYLDELHQWTQPGTAALMLRVGFSRQPGQPRRYVQQLVHEAGSALFEHLQDARTHVFACGLKGMDVALRSALRELAQAHGEDGRAWLRQRETQGRYHVEVY